MMLFSHLSDLISACFFCIARGISAQRIETYYVNGNKEIIINLRRRRVWYVRKYSLIIWLENLKTDLLRFLPTFQMCVLMYCLDVNVVEVGQKIAQPQIAHPSTHNSSYLLLRSFVYITSLLYSAHHHLFNEYYIRHSAC